MLLYESFIQANCCLLSLLNYYERFEITCHAIGPCMWFPTLLRKSNFGTYALHSKSDWHRQSHNHTLQTHTSSLTLLVFVKFWWCKFTLTPARLLTRAFQLVLKLPGYKYLNIIYPVSAFALNDYFCFILHLIGNINHCS